MPIVSLSMCPPSVALGKQARRRAILLLLCVQAVIAKTENNACKSWLEWISAVPPSTIHWSTGKKSSSSRACANIPPSPNRGRTPASSRSRTVSRSRPASASGVLSAKGSTNFVHSDWAGYDIRLNLQDRLCKPVTYLNDGNAGALWGHFTLFGGASRDTSLSAIIGTGLGGGVIVEGNVVKGRKGFGGELGHVLIPYQSIKAIQGLLPECNCGRTGCLESVCSLTAIERSFLPYFLARYPGHDLGRLANLHKATKLVRGMGEKGDPMWVDTFRAQAHALGLFFDEMVNTFDPDALMVGGGALETGEEFQRWFTGEIRAGMPPQRAEQTDIPIYVMPNGDTAGARGAAIEALKLARQTGLIT